VIHAGAIRLIIGWRCAWTSASAISVVMRTASAIPNWVSRFSFSRIVSPSMHGMT